MNNKNNIFVFALLVLTVFCVITSSSAIAVVNAQSSSSNSESTTNNSDKKSEPSTKDTKSNSKKDGNTDVKTDVKADSSSSATTSDSSSSSSSDNKQSDKSTPTPPEITPLLSGPVSTTTTVKDTKHNKKDLTSSNTDIIDKSPDITNSTGSGGTPNPNPTPTPIPIPSPDPSKLPKNCTSQYNNATKTTLIKCNNTVVKVIKGQTHTNTIVKTVPGDTVYKNYYYTYPQTQQQLQYGNSLSANLALYGSNAPASYLLLLDSKQLCLISGDTQCIAQQDRFMTSSITTIYDSSAKEWTVTGTVKDVSPDKLSNIQVTALFYDGKGNTISNAMTNNVAPSKLNSFEDATFSFKVSVKDDLNGKNPVFIVLNYSNDQNSNQHKPSNNNNGPTIGTTKSKYGVPY